MKIFQEEMECIICGQKSKHNVIMSNFISKSPDLDFKPNGSMAGLGSEILQCPHCGYCNYRLDESIDPRYLHDKKSNLTLWKSDEDIKEILEANYLSEVAKKYLIMAVIYQQNIRPKKQFDMIIKASWATEDAELKTNLKQLALDCYLTNILPDVRNQLLQVADTLRQVENYDFAQAFISSVSSLVIKDNSNNEDLKKIIEYEQKLIENKDNNVYSFSDIKK